MVSENSSVSDNFSVVLRSEPTANVTLTLSDNDSTEVTASPTSLSFSSGNWSVAQWITLTGKDDTVSDDNQTVLLTLTPSSGDSKYNSSSLAQTLTVTTIDDDAPYVAITSGHCEGNSYNKITNASTCSTAATSLGYIYSNTIDNSSGQQRCFVSSSDNKAYYNQSNTGNININSQSSAYICER